MSSFVSRSALGAALLFAAGGLAAPLAVAQSMPTASGSWTSVSAGRSHVCALKDDATLWCWGDNRGGQLGIGSTDDQHHPTQVGSDTWLTVAAGGVETCGLRTDHTLWCWGTGPLGRGERYDYSTVPVQIGSGTDWTTVSTGGVYACATRADATLWCWGLNSQGQLGLGERVRAWSPRQVGSEAEWADVRASVFSSTCGLKTDGTAWCWGVYSSKRGNYREQYTPRQLNQAQWMSISVFHGVQADGSLWGWQRGYSVQRYTDDNWTSVLDRDGTLCGIQVAGTLWCEGDGAHGNLGHGTQDQGKFVRVTRATNWSTVDGGYEFGVGLRADGTLWGWGLNDHGQVGDGTRTEHHHPVQILG